MLFHRNRFFTGLVFTSWFSKEIYYWFDNCLFWCFNSEAS